MPVLETHCPGGQAPKRRGQARKKRGKCQKRKDKVRSSEDSKPHYVRPLCTSSPFMKSVLFAPRHCIHWIRTHREQVTSHTRLHHPALRFEPLAQSKAITCKYREKKKLERDSAIHNPWNENQEPSWLSGEENHRKKSDPLQAITSSASIKIPSTGKSQWFPKGSPQVPMATCNVYRSQKLEAKELW